LKARVLPTSLAGRLAARACGRLLVLPVLLVATGCWEQVAPRWFPQMKEQPAVQALEGSRPFEPPAGTIPLRGIEPRIDFPVPAFSPEAAALQNPVAKTAESAARGKYVYEIYCAVCHGSDGMANAATVPVAKRFAESGAPVLPLLAVPAYSDGFLFTKIRYGKPFMPGYPQIPPQDRWHVVNYLRTLMPAAAAATPQN
jgi:mono/diheme cytochrome c family protein